jgi:hypothetical protein
MSTFRRRRSGQHGFITVAYAAMLIGIMGFTGLAVDVGYLQYEKRRIQAAADAAAMGALREMERGNTDTVSAGQNDAALNGFTNGVNNTTVTVGTPTSGTYANNSTAIQATVTRTIPTFFMQVFGQTSVPISATAVAKTSSVQGSIGGCIFVLADTGSGTFNVHGTMNLETGCSIVVNSSDNAAFTGVGNASLLMDNNAVVGVAGGYSFSGGAQVLNNAVTPNTSETPTKIEHFTDPLAGVPLLTPSGTPLVASGGMKIDKKSPLTLSPGVYCGGLDFQSTSGTLTMATGTYVLAGGGLNINAQASVVTAPGGVLFYNTSSTGWGCTSSSAAGGITINGGSTLNLTALTSTDKTYPGDINPVGILFQDDRNTTKGAGLYHKINGNAGNTFDGALYFPNAALNFIGTSSSGGYMVIVTNTLDIGGTSGLKTDFTTLANVNTLAPASTGGGLVQ